MRNFGSLKCWLSVIMCLFAPGLRSAIPSGYYDSLEGKSGVSLKKAVKAVAKPHTVIPYGDASWEVFLESDTRTVAGQRCWWDMYSANNVAAPNASSHSGLNIEHGVPNSWWGKTKNDAYKDLYHLNPSNADANSRKGNYPLGEIATLTWNNGVTFIGRPTSATGDDADYVFEPADEYKGDFARAYFYMFTVYDDISWTGTWDWMYNTSSDLLLKPWAYEMLLRWAREDPVSQKEVDRNEAIYRHQKNRNPFIDFPLLAEHIWGTLKGQPFHIDGSYDPGEDPGEPDIPDTPEPDVPSGLWYAVTSASELTETDRYMLVSTESSATMSFTLGSSGKFFQVCGKLPAFDNSVSPARIAVAPEDAAIFRLISCGSEWNVEVSALSGEKKGYLKSTQNKELTLTDRLTDSGTAVTIEAFYDYTRLSYTYSGKTSYVYYNPSAPRFTTYNSNGQEPVRLYRLEEEKNDDSELTGIATGTAENADETILGIYDINGRRLAGDDMSGFDKGIYIVVTNFGAKKIRK